LGELLTELAGAGDHGPAFHALGAHDSRQHDRRGEVGGEEQRRAERDPGQEDALVEGVERVRRPAQQQEQRDHQDPVAQDVACDAPRARRTGGAARKREREDEQAEDQVGRRRGDVVPGGGRGERAHRHGGFEEDADESGQRERALRELQLSGVCGDHLAATLRSQCDYSPTPRWFFRTSPTTVT
jgi:hypothetical protein